MSIVCEIVLAFSVESVVAFGFVLDVPSVCDVVVIFDFGLDVFDVVMYVKISSIVMINSVRNNAMVLFSSGGCKKI